MNDNNEIGTYIKILSKVEIPQVFDEYNQNILINIISSIRNKIIDEIKVKDNIENEIEYIKDFIVSIHSIVSLYGKNFIYLEKEEGISKNINNNNNEYVVFKSRTPDFNGIFIYLYTTINIDKKIINYVIEDQNENIVKFVVYEENGIFGEIFVGKAKNPPKIFGEKIYIDIDKNKFESFLTENIKFLEKSIVKKESLNIITE